MNFNHCRTDLPVLLLYNLDPSWSHDDIQERYTITQQLVDAMKHLGHPVQELCVKSADLESILRSYHPNEFLVFNWCEELPGVPHSEHHVVQVLERLGFSHTGASARALVLNQDKRIVKNLLQHSKIPTPAWQVYTSAKNNDWSLFPAIVKPAFEHCSYGITRESIIQSKADLQHRVQNVLDELHQPVLVEEFIDSPEYHVGIAGNGSLQVLPPGEIDYSGFNDICDRLCTFESNFDKASIAYQLTTPKMAVDLTKSQLRELEKIVIAAYRTTNCRDYARMDLRLRDGIFYVLDVNPNADISPDTSLVLGAELVGLSYGMLASLFINLAARRHPIFSSFTL